MLTAGSLKNWPAKTETENYFEANKVQVNNIQEVRKKPKHTHTHTQPWKKVSLVKKEKYPIKMWAVKIILKFTHKWKNDGYDLREHKSATRKSRQFEKVT